MPLTCFNSLSCWMATFRLAGHDALRREAERNDGGAGVDLRLDSHLRNELCEKDARWRQAWNRRPSAQREAWRASWLQWKYRDAAWPALTASPTQERARSDRACRNHTAGRNETRKTFLGQNEDVGGLTFLQAFKQPHGRRKIGIDPRAAHRLISSESAPNRTRQSQRRQHAHRNFPFTDLRRNG